MTDLAGHDPAAGFDALLLLSFGGPEGPADVMPFLRNVTRGRGVPEERLEQVAEHYAHFHGISPINAENRALIAALREELRAHDLDLPVYWGNRNWKPYVADAVRQMREDGVRRALVFATSATASFSACRQYRNDMAEARRVAGAGSPELIKLRHFFDHPGFVAANAEAVRVALASMPEQERAGARLVFTAHSVPLAMDAASGPSADGLYSAQQRTTARLVAEAVRGPGAAFDLAWQSRSGPVHVPWLEPDINDHLREVAASGTTAVVVAPTGFVCDHVEVLWDLDNEARATARALGIRLVRAATAGTHPAFVSMVRELVEEQVRGEQPRWLGGLGLCGIECPAYCCPSPRSRATAQPDTASAL